MATIYEQIMALRKATNDLWVIGNSVRDVANQDNTIVDLAIRARELSTMFEREANLLARVLPEDAAS